jgi:hypothetical protein
MHSAMIVVDMPHEPATGAFSRQKWNDFIAEVDGLKLPQVNRLEDQAGVRLVTENVWLIDFQQNPSALAWLVVLANRHRLPYGILQLNDPPQWIPAGFVPMGGDGRR